MFHPPQIAIEEFARLFLERCLPEFVGLFPFFKRLWIYKNEPWSVRQSDQLFALKTIIK